MLSVSQLASSPTMFETRLIINTATINIIINIIIIGAVLSKKDSLVGGFIVFVTKPGSHVHQDLRGCSLQILFIL